ncbi:MAG: hypothetical protein ACM30E_01135 [Nitrososphaerales archaeon]
MKAAHVFLAALLLGLAACSLPASPAASSQPTQAAQPAAAATVTPAAAAPSTAAPAVTSSPVLPARAGTTLAQPTPFSIGAPAGDAYDPFSLAVDPARKLAYVYHADSAEKRPVISVVDLAAGKVTRLIRLDRTTPGASGRLFLAPDGKRLFLQENQDYRLSVIDPATGALRKVLDEVRDAVQSDDGRMLYVMQLDGVAAYSTADLAAGKIAAIWRAKGLSGRLGLNGERLLAASYASGPGTLVSLDVVTGNETGRGDTPEIVNVIAAGPDGGWAIIVGGQQPRLIRYNAALKNLGETPIFYANDLSYDAPRGRYLLGGQRYAEGEPSGHSVILAVDAMTGKQIEERSWPGEVPPSTFVQWGPDALVAFAGGGPGVLDLLDAATLSLKSRITTGVRAQDVVIDDEAQTLYVADDLGRIHVLKLPDGAEAGVWDGAPPIALDKANHRLYVNRSAGVVALDARTGDILAQFPQRGDPAPDPHGDLVYIAERGVTVYDRTGKKLTTLPSTFPVERGFVPNPFASAAQVNPITGHVAVIMNNGIPGSNGGSFLRIYPRQSDKGVEPPAPHSFVMDVVSDHRGNWYVSYSPSRGEQAVQVLSPDGQQLDRLDHRAGFLALDEAKDDLYLFVDGRSTRLAASTLTATDVFEGPEFVAKMAFSPSTRTAYLVGYSGPLVTPVALDSLDPLDLRTVPGRPPAGAYNGGVAVAAQGRGRLLFGQFGETYRTSDGATWERLLPSLATNFGYVTAAGPRTVFVTGVSAVGGEGVWRSADGGDNWEWLTSGLSDLAPQGPVLANTADEAYVINRGQGLLRWDAASGKWQVVDAPSREGQWGPLSLAPDGTLFRSNEGYLQRSSDQGRTWVKLGTSDQAGDVIGYSALYTVTHGIFSAVRSGYSMSGIQRSTDGGQTWQPSIRDGPFPFDGYQPETATGFGKTYLLLRRYTGDPILLRTTDFGDTWNQAPADAVIAVDHIAVDPVDGRLWLGVKGGVRWLDPEKLRWGAVSPVSPMTNPVPTPTVLPPATPPRALVTLVQPLGPPCVEENVVHT